MESVFTTTLIFLFAIASFTFIVAVSFFAIFLNVIPIMLGGAFFAPSNKKEVERMILISGVKPGDKAVDLGSGDGRLVIALAKARVQAHGYEVNPILVWWSRRKIKKAGLSSKAFIHRQNFWNSDLSGFNVVSVFGIKYMMSKLEAKLKKELKPGARVVSNYFVFPNWKHSKKEGNAYLYLKK